MISTTIRQTRPSPGCSRPVDQGLGPKLVVPSRPRHEADGVGRWRPGRALSSAAAQPRWQQQHGQAAGAGAGFSTLMFKENLMFKSSCGFGAGRHDMRSFQAIAVAEASIHATKGSGRAAVAVGAACWREDHELFRSKTHRGRMASRQSLLITGTSDPKPGKIAADLEPHTNPAMAPFLPAPRGSRP